MRAWLGVVGGLLLALGCSRPNSAFNRSVAGDARPVDAGTEAPPLNADGSAVDLAPDLASEAAGDVAAELAPDVAPPADAPPPDLVLPADAPPADAPPPDAPPPDAPPADAPPPDVMEAPLPVGTGLRGQYFDGVELEGGDTGELELTRTDGTINFDWGSGAADGNVDDDWFSVRWTGKVMPLYSETYTFRTETDEGVRLWVNNQLLIDEWDGSGRVVTHTATISLQAYQQVPIRLEYFETTGSAVARLSWMSPSRALQIVPRERLFP